MRNDKPQSSLRCIDARPDPKLREVIDAVAQGLFAVYVVASVDETLELLTEQPAGKVDNEGLYPENSINFKAISRLKEISDMAIDDDKEEGA